MDQTTRTDERIERQKERDLWAGARTRVRNAWPPLMLLGVLLVVWQIAVSVTDVSPLLFAGPAAVGDAMVQEASTGTLWVSLAETMTVLAYGLGTALIFGVFLGLLIGVLPRLDSIVSPYLWAIYSTPRVALAPLVIVWFGLEDTAKIVMAFLSAVVPVMLNCKEGVEAVDRELVEVAYSFGARTRDLYMKVVVPLIVPAIVTGIQTGLSRGFVGVLVVEMLTGTGGLGREVILALEQFDSAQMLAYVLFLVGLALVLMSFTRSLESYVSRWREEVSI